MSEHTEDANDGEKNGGYVPVELGLRQNAGSSRVMMKRT